ncbi:hypothetical protein Aspvir_003350 [Aspergillus viridinutans]|uniref:Uncharacterized protein n=1 Tax=Aspergillus viridinutans TaxID=75553 RepID=A0A9P3C4P1_ASPVI|nr:uncharacterized protein Aspvir_003350 [Aspergillus viridinutans]GIK07684.1 hypothetical protein Aspvir_003350 [Aspergillus viridinutans]
MADFLLRFHRDVEHHFSECEWKPPYAQNCGKKTKKRPKPPTCQDYETLLVNEEGTIKDHLLCDYVMNRNCDELESLRSKLATCRREYVELEERYEKLSDEHSQCPYWLQRREDQAMTAMEKLEEITQVVEEAEKGQSESQT